ncbi:MAG: FtsH protease activity modulator HflK [Porticoccaceae bacterium]|jgi:membrane protease subunit HflK|nr:FtsH protease activity modulator HflK [Porticoccaceae bacterium]
MAWNEPGGGKDPWGSGQGSGPPDLDEALKKLREKFGRFGGGAGSGSGGSGTGGFKFLPILLLLLVAIWALSGIYQVDEKERAVVLRFGKFVDTVGPGLHWNPPLVDSVTVVRVTEERQYQNDARDLMLTQDENIVDLQLVVQYNIADPKAFVLNVRDPEISLRHATNSALRHVVGSTKLDAVISSGREQVGVEVKERVQSYLDNYETGINVVKVNIQDAKPPSQVKAAYDDVIKAREDQERVVSEAQSYANGVIPEARGFAQRIIEEANGYKARVVAEAEGEAARFENLLSEYQKAPEVTRQRLYLDAMQAVMSNSSKVMVGADNGSNIFYLPLDKAVEAAPDASPSSTQRLTPAQMSTIADEIVNRLRAQASDNPRKELR